MAGEMDVQPPGGTDPSTGSDAEVLRAGGQFLAQWASYLAGQETAAIGQVLPPHSQDCVGCGPANPAGLGLQVVRTAEGVEAVHSFDAPHVGAPGIAHGGAVALAFDDLFGFTLYTVGALAVTRSLTVEYQAPFRLHHPYTFRAQLRERNGRRLLLHAEAWDNVGRMAGSATATFVVVRADHFVSGGERPDGEVD